MSAPKRRPNRMDTAADQPPRYTLAEAARLLQIGQCARHGHQPGPVIMQGDDPVAAYCECGIYQWQPRKLA